MKDNGRGAPDRTAVRSGVRGGLKRAPWGPGIYDFFVALQLAPALVVPFIELPFTLPV